MNKKFQVIVADCPWSFKDSLKMSDVARGAEANYNTMSISDIKGLPIKDITDPAGAVLALWVPSSLLQEGLDTMNAWGFNHKQTYIWVKTKKEPFKNLSKISYKAISEVGWFIKPLKEALFKVTNKLNLTDLLSFGMGRLFRQTHEICLIGTNNNGIYKILNNKSQRSVSFGENLKHSAKPEDLQNSLEIMFPSVKEKIELFSRRQRKNWICLGNESPMTKGEDIRESLIKLNSIEHQDLIPINKIISCYDEGKNKELFEMWSELSINK